jgi:hypothetical protein
MNKKLIVSIDKQAHTGLTGPELWDIIGFRKR